MTAYRRIYDSRHLQAEWLTAKNRDQLRNPRLVNPVWATFTFCKKRLYDSTVLLWLLHPTKTFPFIHIRLLVEQLTKRNFAIELKLNETVTGLKRKLM